jgi:hypothetical protein
MVMSKEAMINLSQAAAKMLIRTNPATRQDSQLIGLATMLVKYMLADDCHHELLQFEGLMALTSMSASTSESG